MAPRRTSRQVEGIGPLTFVLTVEDPYRFEKSRSVRAYLGLVPTTERSVERDPQRPISKEGDEMLRKLLVGSAHYILGPFGSDSDLRRHGEKIASRGAKNAKKRAVVAVARKLAVLLHRLWVTAEVYDPLHNAHRRTPFVLRVVLGQVATLPLVIAGVAVLSVGPGGLYWLMAGTIFSILAALFEAWVLLVEINR